MIDREQHTQEDLAERRPPADEQRGQEDLTRRRLPAVEQLAERFGAVARASVVFGEPIVRNNVTVVPVARATWGLGGGWGGGQSAERGGSQGSGGGTGGGLSIDPAGYIEITDAGTRYRPIVDPLAWFKAALFGGLIGLLLTRLGRRH